MPKDWFEWHNLYQREERLQQRLEIVQGYITRSLDAQPPGPIQIVSACAGDGRDLRGALLNHPRRAEVSARLIELNPQLVEQGQSAIGQTGLANQIELLQGDATLSDNYAGAVPADIVLVCGIFGNLADEAALQQLIGNLKFLAKTGALVAWTRGHRDGIAYSDLVRQTFQSAQFEEVDFQLTATGDMGVGLHRYVGTPAPLPANQHLFVFSGSPDRAVAPT
ncbi:class I SAM-dependent methyltransferase family protein [Alkalinema sp. FACHB-956]|uniref:class I SAM-dependent methyltransferase family protein n=1 Tax=Alkalinema sp. FACHB-956 TaxID=2692768 RepID=UPI00168670EE|nr:class I SAM-dependent methyltransferase family protein [Alkalinema sp. FACHB-956]MBD2329230.1 class I SAM-dependent methyltransferase family protein [Alkalinema sp. FACHB-956]